MQLILYQCIYDKSRMLSHRYCTKSRYQLSQFKTVFALVKAGRSLPDEGSLNACPAIGVQYKEMAAYSKSFIDRIDKEVDVL